jgi:hypothetical protein
MFDCFRDGDDDRQSAAVVDQLRTDQPISAPLDLDVGSGWEHRIEMRRDDDCARRCALMPADDVSNAVEVHILQANTAEFGGYQRSPVLLLKARCGDLCNCRLQRDLRILMPCDEIHRLPNIAFPRRGARECRDHE